MNEFNTYSEKEIEDLVQKKAQKIKPQLQLEIEELYAEKVVLENKIKEYQEVFNKVNELKNEFLKIENDLT
jgi:hypothetical protein